MLTSYSQWHEHLIKMIKIRAANYVETDCDIKAIIETVYNDLQNTCLFEIYREEFTVEDNADITIAYLTADQIYMLTDVLDILDKNDMSILDMMYEKENRIWAWNRTTCSGDGSVQPTCCDMDTVTFVRKSIAKIESLSPEEYHRITFAMLEGMMYYVQTAIPAQVDAQVGNFSYQRYYNAKKALMDMQPQHRFYTTKEKQWL